jgi:2-amino-4-hydroxy-6-hydroxymethyldihydropteridine diphosphokinase
MQHRVYLLLGTNLGNKELNLKTATSLLVTELAPYLFSDVNKSSILESEPWGFISADSFLNQAISFVTSVTPQQLLQVCKYVEKKMGRVDEPLFDDNGERIYRSRIIDIDILLFGDLKIETPDLIIPHPRLYEREFALIPLREIQEL